MSIQRAQAEVMGKQVGSSSSHDSLVAPQQLSLSCVSLQRTASKGRGAGPPQCVNEGWEAPRAGHKVFGFQMSVQFHKLQCCGPHWAIFSGGFRCPSMLYLALPLLCLVLVFIPPEQGSSVPVEGTYPICSYWLTWRDSG